MTPTPGCSRGGAGERDSDTLFFWKEPAVPLTMMLAVKLVLGVISLVNIATLFVLARIEKRLDK